MRETPGLVDDVAATLWRSSHFALGASLLAGSVLPCSIVAEARPCCCGVYPLFPCRPAPGKRCPLKISMIMTTMIATVEAVKKVQAGTVQGSTLWRPPPAVRCLALRTRQRWAKQLGNELVVEYTGTIKADMLSKIPFVVSLRLVALVLSLLLVMATTALSLHTSGPGSPPQPRHGAVSPQTTLKTCTTTLKSFCTLLLSVCWWRLRTPVTRLGTWFACFPRPPRTGYCYI